MLTTNAITKPLLTLMIAMLSTTIVFAQKKAEEQMDRKSSPLQKYRSSSVRSTESLLQRAEDIKSKNPEQALDLLQDALAESIAQGNDFNEARSYLLIAEINEQISEWSLASQNFEKAHLIIRSQKTTDRDSRALIRTLRGLGKSYMETNQYETALRYFNELLALTKDSTITNETHLAISEVYYRMGNYDAALDAANKVLTGKTETSLDIQSNNQRAKIYAQKKDFDKTRGYIDTSISVVRGARPKADEQSLAPALNSIQQTKEEVSDVFRENELYDDEINLRNQSVQYNLENNNLGEVARDKVELSKTLEAKGERSAALKELVEAAAIADTIDAPKDRASAFLSLAELYQENGQSSNALSAYKKYSDAVRESEQQAQLQLEQRNRLLRKQEEIQNLGNSLYVERSEENAQQAIIETQRWVIVSLIAVVLIIGITSIMIYRSAQSSKRANQLLALKSLRSQMNPHFIFNALNSVNHFIAQQDERTANRFLSDFSQLMRLVLENSQEDFITLQKEQEILALYIKLEHYRFRDKFDYEIEIDESINPETFRVPPMLIQPYLENAIWHGLRYRESKGHLKLTMIQQGSSLVVRVHDNGIGRKKSAELKTENQKKHRSTGLKNIRERLTILNNVYHTNYQVNVSDGEDGQGTTVDIVLPAQTAAA